MKRLKNQRGVTLLELVFYISLSSIIFVVAAAVMATQLDIFSDITQRQGALQDIRYAVDQMSDELIRVQHTTTTTTITAISPTRIDFTDRDGVVTNYRQASNGTDQAIYRGDDVLASPVESLLLEYYDQAGVQINGTDAAAISSIRRIKITVRSQEVDDEGTLEVTNTVTPRNLIYQNYQ